MRRQMHVPHPLPMPSSASSSTLRPNRMQGHLHTWPTGMELFSSVSHDGSCRARHMRQSLQSRPACCTPRTRATRLGPQACEAWLLAVNHSLTRAPCSRCRCRRRRLHAQGGRNGDNSNAQHQQAAGDAAPRLRQRQRRQRRRRQITHPSGLQQKPTCHWPSDPICSKLELGVGARSCASSDRVGRAAAIGASQAPIPQYTALG